MVMWELVPSAASNLCYVAVLGNPCAFAQRGDEEYDSNGAHAPSERNRLQFPSV